MASDANQLKVGELARLTGLTVRTLHHYDAIGLLMPSGRSEAGYRLYGQRDVARLHAIQALRHIGMPLAEMADMLEGRGNAPARLIDRQIQALEGEIERATALRAHLGLMREKLLAGGEPTLEDWLDVLARMATFGKYFSADELKTILDGFERIQEDWTALVADVQAMMDSGTPAHALAVQPLARRWMALVHHWMRGDFSLIDRWDQMYRREPYAQIGRDAPPEPMLRYMRIAVELRMAATLRHLTQEDLARLQHVPDADWRALDAGVRSCVARGDAPASTAGRALAARWLALWDHMTAGDAGLRARFWAAGAAEPVLAAGSPLGPEVRQFLRAALYESA